MTPFPSRLRCQPWDLPAINSDVQLKQTGTNKIASEISLQWESDGQVCPRGGQALGKRV